MIAHRAAIVRLIFIVICCALSVGSAVAAVEYAASTSLFYAEGAWQSLETSLEIDVAAAVTVGLFIVAALLAIAALAVALWPPRSLWVAGPGLVLVVVAVAIGIGPLNYFLTDYYGQIIEPQLWA